MREIKFYFHASENSCICLSKFLNNSSLLELALKAGWPLFSGLYYLEMVLHIKSTSIVTKHEPEVVNNLQVPYWLP